MLFHHRVCKAEHQLRFAHATESYYSQRMAVLRRENSTLEELKFGAPADKLMVLQEWNMNDALWRFCNSISRI